MVSLIDKIKAVTKAPEVIDAIASDPNIPLEASMPETTMIDETPIEEAPTTEGVPTAAQEFADFNEQDVEAIMNMGPLGAIFEYIEPLILAATSEEFIDFLRSAHQSRKEFLESMTD